MDEKELQVVVNQTPGEVKWNFEQLKDALEAKLKVYETLVYTDENVKDAKADLADLRKLRKQVEDKRKKVKNVCLQPYAIIEAQSKELVALIDKPIGKIDEQVQKYEDDRKAKIKAEIISYMTEMFSNLPDDIAKKLQFKIYDAKWENVTTSKKTWQSAIDDALGMTNSDLKVLDEVSEEFKEEAMNVYKQNLVLSAAMMKVTELQKQKERILEAERQRQEAERRRQEEERLNEERRRIAEEERRKAEEQKAEEVKAEVEQIPFYEPEVKEEIPAEEVDPDMHHSVVRIIGTDEQIDKIFKFIKYVGAVYEEVPDDIN